MSKTYEDEVSQIDGAIAKSRAQWQLNFLSYMDYNDVSQIIRLHIYRKWDQWDQEKPIGPWLNKIIKNQIINMRRNNYGRLAPPCSNCPCNQGAGLCSLTVSGKQDSNCSEFLSWAKKKKRGHEMKIAKPITDAMPVQPSTSHRESSFDINKSAEKVHQEVIPKLNCIQKKVYTLVYIQHFSDEEAARRLKFKTSEKDRFPGYRQMNNIKKQLMEKVRIALTELDVVYEPSK